MTKTNQIYNEKTQQCIMNQNALKEPKQFISNQVIETENWQLYMHDVSQAKSALEE